ncbi:hypothetical protein P154DRAFT_520534 [Amniculicola lignicola CBS 123094]|uniref:Uncharacterized protein n=1 Tax=Amniculicola lignicola CBS 123094 TaxID=1392246 RepID=A0A6A5WUL4_9PLEO|nr:hypothetical protein P154DRAFT_520534 [Amniculicola lignicola CBS 123094]
MADRCTVCGGWMNTTRGGTHNCPGNGSGKSRPEDPAERVLVSQEDEIPQLVTICA